jgi:hypothetical protein
MSERSRSAGNRKRRNYPRFDCVADAHSHSAPRKNTGTSQR